MCTPCIESQKWLPWQRPSAPLEPHLAHDSYGPSEPINHNPNGNSIGSAVFAQGTAECPTRYNGTPLSPQHCFFPWGCGPHLIHGSLGPPESSSQTASWSVQPFWHGSLVWQSDRPTDRPTNHATRSVTIGCIYIYIRSTSMRPNNGNENIRN